MVVALEKVVGYGQFGFNIVTVIMKCREIFNKWQAQRWWAENQDKVIELYNVRRLSHHAVPLPTPPQLEDEISKVESMEDSPETPRLIMERLPHHIHQNLPEQKPMQPRQYCDSSDIPKVSSVSAAKIETLSVDDASARSSSSREIDHSGELSVSNASDLETEWVEQDEPGVYITIRTLQNGARELRRVRFSRERFGESQARLWWEENKLRIQQQFL